MFDLLVCLFLSFVIPIFLSWFCLLACLLVCLPFFLRKCYMDLQDMTHLSKQVLITPRDNTNKRQPSFAADPLATAIFCLDLRTKPRFQLLLAALARESFSLHQFHGLGRAWLRAFSLSSLVQRLSGLFERFLKTGPPDFRPAHSSFSA